RRAMSTVVRTDLDQLCVNTIRTLSMDAVQSANSGHPGAPMGLAPVAYCLWQRYLRFDPADPIWPNRDRFVLSAGHASMLLYSMLFLTGVRAVDPDYEIEGTPAVSLDDIKSFRQLDSKCPGHPEYRWTYEDDVQTRFEGYQWNVTRVEDANDLDQIARGFDNFREEQNRPTLIIVDSHIGYGAPHKQDTAEAHGEPLGDEEVKETKRFYG